MKKLLSIILSITMLLSMATVAFADETVTSTGAKEVEDIIKVGVNAEFPPFEYMENGKIVGFDIDLMNYIAGRIGYGVEFVNMSFDKLIPAVVNGEVDCAISAITATDERESVVDFTRPYLAANVTYKDEDSASEELEMYSIVFKDGVSDAIYKSSMPTDYEKLFMLVNGTIEELISDATVEKLIEKYELNKSTAETGYSYFIASEVPGDVEIGVDSETTIPAPSEWAAKDIDFAYAAGITDSNKQYIYQNNITREEFCELIYNFYNNLANDRIVVCDQNPFTDTDNKHITSLNEMSIIYGKSETEFAPADLLTREEATTILFRIYLDFKPETKLNKRPAVGVFLDDESISDWAYTGVYIMASDGIEVMVGDGNNLNYHPKRTLTTQEAIVALVRLYDRTINPETGNIIIKNAEDLSYGQIKELQLIVNGGHYPWRLDYEEVLKNFLNDRGINVENGKITELAGGGGSSGISLTYSVQEKEYVIELFQPIDTGEHGIWIVRTCEER